MSTRPNQKERETVLNLYPNVFRVTYRPKENIPEALAAIIGDAIGNLRAALDHLATGIVTKWGTLPKGPLYFPVTPRKDLAAHSGLTAIEQALPGAKELLLKDIRPDGGPNEHLWDFYTLNKDDKHNFFIPTVAGVGVGNINVRTGNPKTGGLFMDNCMMSFDAARSKVLISSILPIAINDDFKTTVEVRFGHGTPFQYEPVIPTLTQISDVVSETLNAFERLMVATKP